MNNNFPQPKYIYTGGKPEINLGDSSIESESFDEIEDGKENINDINLTENYFEIPKESEIPLIHIPFNDIELFPKNKQGLFFCSATKDTENGCTRLNSNNKDDNFSIKNKFKFNKENNRYSNITSLYKNNFRFLNSLQINNEYDSEDEDIVNNEISVNFVDAFMKDNKIEKDEQIEIILDKNFSKRFNGREINNKSNNSIITSLNRNKINEIKKENLIKKNEINENIQNIIKNININKNEWNKNSEKKKNANIDINLNEYKDKKYSIENKENFIRNGGFDTEININLDQIEKCNKIIEIDKSKINNINNISNNGSINCNLNNKINNISNNSYINKNINDKINNVINSNIKMNLNNKFFEIKNSQKSIDLFLSKSKSSRNISMKRKKYQNILNLTKKYKIFHKFLCVSVDTSNLYTLDDDMNSLLLNPKITYNYPYNNLEKELE